MINQREFIRRFNDKHRDKFNPDLFIHTDDDIIEELKKVILSCQRDRVFTIRVEKFTVVRQYAEIQQILRDYEAKRLRNKPNEENRYNYISLKDSDIQLLIVDYFIAIKNDAETDPAKTSKNLRVIIEVPRIVDKYYYRIFGNLYSSTYQIIESTYNNSTSNSKSSMVVLKTMFMASRFYRYNIENSKEMKLKSTDGNYMTGVYYQSSIFNKPVLAMKYLLARYGLYGLMEEFKAPYIQVLNEDPLIPDNYTVKRHNVYVSVPKFIYDKDPITQSLLYTICSCISKDTTADDMFTIEFWLECLGESFSSPTVEKGLSILESLESIFDAQSKEHLHLPEDQKEDIYQVLIWLIREYQSLRLKDNLDISMKRIRGAEYIAALYATKISKGIYYRISDKGNKVTLSQIEKAINTYPDYLIKTIARDPLINYKNSVNDLDAVSALKFTYKGLSGLGETGQSIPQQYRQVHKSHLGRLDLTAVSSSDPGLTGMLCPTVDLYNGSFSQNPEPNSWREEVDQMLSEYRQMVGIKEALMIKKDLGVLNKDDASRLVTVEDSLTTMSYLMIPIKKIEDAENIM